MDKAFYFLLAFTFFREILFQVSINKLVNKLMSRNYYDYLVSDASASRVGEEDASKVMVEELQNTDTLNGIHPLA